MVNKPTLLDISIAHAGWRRLPRLASNLNEAAEVTLATLPKSLRFPCSFTLLLTSNAKIRQLNRDFRGIDKPTNVLSFPQCEPRELTKSAKKASPLYLGDVAIAYQYIVGEAKADHKMLINHCIHLMIHGVLHLFGYDHALNREAVHMERLEQKIMHKLGLPNPYQIAPSRASKRKRLA